LINNLPKDTYFYILDDWSDNENNANDTIGIFRDPLSIKTILGCFFLKIVIFGQNLKGMEKLPNLPIGQQYFKSIIKGKAIYVDKTEYIYNLCQPIDKGYFLSRPRRFGKSLIVDTISELFSGNRDLFDGLWIADKWDWSETYPVIRMSLDAIGHEAGLKQALFKDHRP
jgi:hypothetical protein